MQQQQGANVDSSCNREESLKKTGKPCTTWLSKFRMASLWSNLWAKRPTAQYSLWRMVQRAPLDQQFGTDATGWELNDMELFVNADCSVKINLADTSKNNMRDSNLLSSYYQDGYVANGISLIANAITRANSEGNGLKGAFDDLLNTKYVSDCGAGGCN